ncbi:hypothetical protein [Pseudomonas sp. B111]|uniref:hypothetical protein n=1 Tax=Pseudomonas sp. B111 TaxID=2944252 RepID=UPI002264D97E|nr:hypothetical protein [Pseudomonas sp. B111]UZX36786.1 hypothetical protein M6E97_30500 [Pseudomonas sp. B111]HEJ6187131.1 hypothetical protein [Pseudomonas aeruginosa]
MPTLECTVKYYMGAYQTNTVRSQRASCSHSEDEAVRHLGVKLFGEQLDHVERIDIKPGDKPGMSRWLIVGREA